MPRKKKTKPLINLIVISDLHCGCRLGLCPPEVQLDDAAIYTQTPIQRDIWKRWGEFWTVWIPRATKGEPFAVVLNGDALDGVHHRAVTQISHNLTDQARIAKAVLRPVVEACEGRYYHIRGTEAHVGPSGQEEERLAEELGAIPDAEGRHARWELWIEVGVGLVHITHHIGTASGLAYETTAIQKEAEQALVEAARWDERFPDVLVRSHRHRNAETRLKTKHGFLTACTTPGWQAKTPFVFKIAGGRQTQPQIGGTLVRSDETDIYTLHRLWNLARTKTEKPRIEVA
jgi:hypothetical protein